MEKLTRDQFIPNDCFASSNLFFSSYHNQGECNFQIVTGYNMSGKSTYLKSIALVSIMAHIGSFG